LDQRAGRLLPPLATSDIVRVAGQGVFACSRTAVIATGLAGCLLVPASATAATTLGQLDPAGTPTGSCVGTSYWAQASSTGVSYTVPAGGGVITSWSHRANASSGRELGLRVFRPESGTNFTLIGGSGVQTLTANTVNTFETQISVQAGDVLGLYVGNASPFFPFSGGASCAYTGSGATTQGSFGMNPEPATGASVNLLGTYSSILLNVTARVEADADGDGFGDETQDGCPALAGPLGGCSASTTGPADKTPPQGKIKNGSDSVRDGSVSITLLSTEAATATVSGSVSVPNAAKVYRLAGRTVSLKPNVPQKVKLKLSKKARRAVYKFLRRGRKLRANVQVVLKDPAGNTGKVKQKVKLRL